jgi:hypothetical protein
MVAAILVYRPIRQKPFWPWLFASSLTKKANPARRSGVPCLRRDKRGGLPCLRHGSKALALKHLRLSF